MIIDFYILSSVCAAVGALYLIFGNDREYYTHIIAGVASGILLFMLSYSAYSGIEVANTIVEKTYTNGSLTAMTSSVQTTSYSYGWLGLLLAIGGTLVILLTFVKVYSTVDDEIHLIE